jgi:hypothetical protein
MGILVQNYTTEQGFLVPELYIQVNCIRMLKTMSGPTYGLTYISQAFKSVSDFQSGATPITIPTYLANIDDFQDADNFFDQTIFGFAYAAIKKAWEAAGYTVYDWYPNPPTPTTYIYDCSGYNFRGFNCAGYDKDGYDKDGFNKDGWDREGYGRDGYNAEGYNRQGYDRDGYDRDGYDYMGYDRQGYDRQGYNRQGCNRENKDKDGNPCPA